ncbi:VOC family protein [Paenibacillus sp. GCM10023252]|uniref:VOC family protein n=1 Tax=Paenibacillus sp. GCM10023252 TaxID=3252649 RepID=UPI00361A179A
MSQEFNITRIGQVSIPVQNIEQAAKFYHETLGLTLLFQLSNMAFLECNGVRLMLSVPEHEEYNHPSSIFYFNVEDIHASYETLLARDVTFLGKPHIIAEMNGIQTWMAFFRDPDLNTQALMSEVAASAAQ